MYKFIIKKIDFLIPLLIIGFSFFIAYHNVGSGIINYIDHNFPFYFSDHLNRLFFMWNDWIYLGFDHATNLINGISYYSIFYFFEKLGFNYILINRLECVISIFCIVYFTYLFLQSLFKNEIKILHKLFLVLVSTFFLTNISTMGLFTMGLTQGVFALSGVPLVLFSLRKYGLTHRKVFLLLVVIGSLIITSFNLPYNVISMIAVLLLAILFNDIDFKLKIKNIFIFLIIWLFINSFWVIPMFYSIFIVPPYNLKETIENTSELNSVMQLTATRYTLDQLMRLGINLDLVKVQNNDNSLVLNYFASKWYVILSYITIISLFLWHLIFKKEKNKMSINPLFLIGIFLVFIFLAKGLNQPFGGLYNYLFNKTTFFKMFRDSLKWMTIPFLAVIILMANILVDSSKKWLKLIIILFLLLILFPWVYDGLMGGLRAYNVPDYYFALNNYYKNTTNLSNKRAIILDSVVAPTSFEFDVGSNNKKKLSNNILKFTSPFPPVDLFSNGGGISSDYIKNIFENLTKTDEDITAFQELGATHIYHQRDLVNSATYNYTDKYFNKTTFGKVDVYEIKKDYILPKIFLSNTDEYTALKFLKINPTKYKLSVNNIKSNVDLNFLYTIDQNWKLYLKQNPTSSWCQEEEKYAVKDDKYYELTQELDELKKNSPRSENYRIKEGESYWSVSVDLGLDLKELLKLNNTDGANFPEVGKDILIPIGNGAKEEYNKKIKNLEASIAGLPSKEVTECQSDQKFFQGEELSYLTQKPVFDDSHKVVNEYANEWTIDPEYIKNNFDPSYYKVNPDGSIDIEMTLYFKPQSYFYIGLIVSGTTLVGCIIYLVIASIVGRKRRSYKVKSYKVIK